MLGLAPPRRRMAVPEGTRDMKRNHDVDGRCLQCGVLYVQGLEEDSDTTAAITTAGPVLTERERDTSGKIAGTKTGWNLAARALACRSC